MSLRYDVTHIKQQTSSLKTVWTRNKTTRLTCRAQKFVKQKRASDAATNWKTAWQILN